MVFQIAIIEQPIHIHYDGDIKRLECENERLHAALQAMQPASDTRPSPSTSAPSTPRQPTSLRPRPRWALGSTEDTTMTTGDIPLVEHPRPLEPPLSAESLRAFRLAHDMSRRQLAALIGVSPRTVTNWEQGVRAVAIPVARLLPRVTPADLAAVKAAYPRHRPSDVLDDDIA